MFRIEKLYVYRRGTDDIVQKQEHVRVKYGKMGEYNLLNVLKRQNF